MSSAAPKALRWRTWAVAGAVACYMGLALADGLDRLSATMPQLARYVPEAFHSANLAQESLNASAKGQVEQGESLARRAMLASPLDSRSSAALGLAHLLRGKAEAAQAAFTFSAQRGWRAAPTQTYWLQIAREMGDYRVAGLRLDALLRLHPASLDNRTIMEPLEQDPAMREAMADRLMLHPNWEQTFTHDVIQLSDESLAARVDVLARLAQKGQPLGCEGARMLVNQLTGRNQNSVALQLWRSHCPAAQKGLIVDPDFSLFQPAQEGATELSWLSESSGDIALRRRQGALQVGNSGAIAATFLRQKLVLPAGRYRLTWQASGSGGAAAIVPLWGCDITSSQMLPVVAQGQGPQGEGLWQADADWDGRCPSVWLNFMVKPVEGMVTFARPQLTRLP